MSKESIILALVDDMLINSIRILRDEDFQRRIWFRREGPEVSSYTDTIEHLLGACDKIFDISRSQEYLGNENYSMLQKLYLLVKEHVMLLEDRVDLDLLKENELLDDPSWHDIQTLAEKVEEKLGNFVKEHAHD